MRSRLSSRLSSNPGKKKSSGFFRVLISLWIVFHLCAILFAPNLEQRLADPVRGALIPYIGIFEFSNRWSFFAPEPGPPTIYVDAELRDAQDGLIQKVTYPEVREHFWLSDRWARRMASTEFMISRPDRIERVLRPYFCRQNPSAHSVVLSRRWKKAPSPEAVMAGVATLRKGQDGYQSEILFRGFCGGP